MENANGPNHQFEAALRIMHFPNRKGFG